MKRGNRRMSDNIVDLPGAKKPEKKNALNMNDVQSIGILTTDGRHCFIDDRADIVKLFKFIVAEKIKLTPG